MNEAQNNVNRAQTSDNTKKKLPKCIKLYYYPLLVLVALVLIIVSFVTYYCVGASTKTSVDTSKAYSYGQALSETERNAYTTTDGELTSDGAAALIKSYLDGSGISESVARKERETNPNGSEVNNKSVDQKITADFIDGKATYTFMDMSALGFVLDRDTVSDMTGGDYVGKEGEIYSRAVKDFIIALPGENPGGDAVVIMTHYDSLLGSNGATSAAAVGAMLGTVETLKDESFKNDVVFVITDGRYDGNVGAYAFKNQFVGFDNVYSRTKAVFNFDAITAGGALTVVRTTDGDNGIMSGYVKSDASVRLDTSVADLLEGSYTSDLDAFYDKIDDEWEVTGMDFAFTAGKYDAGTKADNAANVTENAVAQYASAMENIAQCFGNADLSALKANGDSSAYTYLGGSFATTDGWVYAISGLLIILLAVSLAFAAKKKAFGIKNMFKGVGGVLLTLTLSLAAFIVAYFLIGLLTVAFGAATMNMLLSAHLLTPGVLIPAMLFAGAVSCGLYPLFKRAFRIKAADCVRGGAVTQIVVAVCFGFIVPTAALPYLIIGLINGAVMLLSVLLKNVFAQKFGFGMERLFLYTLPTIIGVPFLVQSFLTIGNLFPIITLPFLLLAFALTLSSIAPYFDYLKPVMSDVYEKLPSHTIRVVETVTEEKEDAVKKGKFQTVTETKVLNKKVKWKYHNWFGVTFVCVLTSLILLIAAPVSATIGITANGNVSASYDYTVTDNFDAVYDNGVVCYIDASFGDPSTFGWRIKDEWVYKNIRNIDGFDYYKWTWDDDIGAYKTATEYEYRPDAKPQFNKDNITDEGNGTHKIAPIYGDQSLVKLEISNISRGDVLTVAKSAEDLTDEPDYSITFDDPAGTVTVVLPSGYADKFVNVKDSNGNGKSVTITAYEYMSDAYGELVVNSAEMKQDQTLIKEYFETEFNETINFTFVIKTRG